MAVALLCNERKMKNESRAAQERDGPGFESPFCACSPRACVGFLRFPPTVQTHAVRLIEDCESE